LANPSMNIGDQGVEQDRTYQEVGFSIDDRDVGPAQTAFHSLGPDRGTLPGELPSPLLNAVTHTSDTQKPDLGPTAHDITRSTRNG
jgi:hypothetical protein